MDGKRTSRSASVNLRRLASVGRGESKALRLTYATLLLGDYSFEQLKAGTHLNGDLLAQVLDRLQRRGAVVADGDVYTTVVG